jgi:hypothetical protein
MLQVVNRHTHKPTLNDIYIGRGSALGNPYPITATSDRTQVIELYRVWLDEKIQADDEAVCDALNHIAYLYATGHSVNLVCFCCPRACHGDVIIAVILAKLKMF